MNLFTKLFYKLKLRFYNNESWEYYLTLVKMLNPEDVSYSSKVLNLKKLKISFKQQEYLYILKAYDYLVLLVEHCDINFSISDNKFNVFINGLHYEIQTSEEIFILKEIFVDGVYNFKVARNIDDYVLIDIGMNVAIASCYFLFIKKISKIISFEPFEPTYQQALVNIDLNKCQNKISPKMFGLGSKDAILEVEYAPDFRGQVGTQGIDSIKSKIHQKQIEKIDIRNTTSILVDLEKKNKEKRFIFKIDCEGAEYDLVPKIPNEILLKTDLLMIEWHAKGPGNIEKWLYEKGFNIVSLSPESKSAGMVYAFKNH